MCETRSTRVPWLVASRRLLLGLAFLAPPAVLAQDAPEYLDDSDGGFMTVGQKAQTVTLTSAHVLVRALSLRLEYRGDFTQEPYFTDSDGQRKDSQHPVLVGLVFTFGGKI